MKRIARIAGIVVIVLVAALASLPFLINANDFRPLLESNLTEALAREVKLGELKLAVLSGGVSADDLSVADDPAFSRTPFLRAKSLKVGVELMPLIFSRKLNVTGLTIDEPAIVLLQGPSGTWNFSSFGAKTAGKAEPVSAPSKGGLDLSVRLVKISDGKLTLGRAHANGKPFVLEKMNLELRDFSAASVFPFSLSAKVAGGGDIKLQGKAGPIHGTDAAMTPVDASLAVGDLDLVRSGLLEASTGMAGLVSIDGDASSNGRTVKAKGRIKGEKMKFAKGGTAASRPVELDFTVAHDMARHTGALSRGDVHIGKAAATLGGTYNLQGPSPVVNLKLAGPNMPLPELVAMLPALDIVLPAGASLQGGTANADLMIAGPLDRLVSSGSLGVENTRVAGFDLGSKMAVVASLAGIKGGPSTDIQLLGSNVKVGPAGTSIDGIKLVAPSIGELTGAGTVSPAHGLDFRMRATLRAAGTVMTVLGQKGDAGIPFLVQGTSSNPVFKPDVKSLAAEKMTEKIETLTKGSEVGKAAAGILGGFLGGKKK